MLIVVNEIIGTDLAIITARSHEKKNGNKIYQINSKIFKLNLTIMIRIFYLNTLETISSNKIIFWLNGLSDLQR